MPVVTLLDILDLPSFLFATNRLRDAVGAVALVEQLSTWTTAVCAPQDVLLARGGQAFLRFPEEAQARAALARLSRRVYREAPGLELIAAHVSYRDGGLAQAIQQGFYHLEKAKGERLPSVPLLGLGVTASCGETRLPATDFDGEGQPISASVAALRKAEGTDLWKDLLPTATGQLGPGWPTAVDQLGSGRDGRRLIGMVRIDGGSRGIVEDPSTDETFLARMRQLSDDRERLGRQALAEVVRRAVAIRDRQGETGWVPVRPLLLSRGYGTFLCAGRLALDLARTALAVYERNNPQARAGVAILPDHVSLARSYALAVTLCDEAQDDNSSRLRMNLPEGSDIHLSLEGPTP